MIIQNDTPESQNENDGIIKDAGINKKKTWIYRIICILLFAAGIVFFICFFNPSNDMVILNYSAIIILCVFAAVFTAAWCFIKTVREKTAVKFTALIIAGVIMAAGWFVYFRYIPKYEPGVACAIVNVDPKYTSATIKPHYYNNYSRQLLFYEIKDNPFWGLGYLLEVVSDGKVTAWIAFDTATGKYELFEYQPGD